MKDKMRLAGKFMRKEGCKQGVKSSNLSVSIVDVIKLLQSTLYLENFIQMI